MLRGWILEYSDVDLLCGDERYGQLQAMMDLAWHAESDIPCERAWTFSGREQVSDPYVPLLAWGEYRSLWLTTKRQVQCLRLVRLFQGLGET